MGIKSERVEDITEKLKRKLTPGRFNHTMGVAYTAACMAMRYGEDMEKAYVAGLLHDCAKCISDEEKIRRCEEYGIEITDGERRAPSLLHAKLGAWYALHKYDVRDEEICSAVRYHTTGRPYMTLLEKIIFVADYIEPNRNKAPNLAEIRKICFDDIDKGVCAVAYATLNYLDESGENVDPATAKTYEYYKTLISMEDENGGRSE